MKRLMLLMLAILLIGSVAMAQQKITVSGTVVDAQGQPLIGATVLEKGSTRGTFTDATGAFTLAVSSRDAILEFLFIGYKTVEMKASALTTAPVVLTDDQLLLDEVVIIGYGQVKKKDLTGAITNVTTKDFQKGEISSPDRLIMGKVPGVQVITNSGMPGSGSRIRIRGGASLNASNDPLIVLDGVPLDNSNVAGSPSLLSSINPDDVESMSVLKDASATAIYGSRASNGVIIITTKRGLTKGADGKGGNNFKINFSTLGSVSTIMNKINLLSGDQVRDIVNNHPQSNATLKALLGAENTDWQDQIYQTALGTDNNLSLSGNLLNTPYRVSVGYLNQNGTLKTGNMERISGAINLSPKFFDEHLRVDLNARGISMNNRYANTDAIGAAVAFDPTQPVYDANSPFGGYFTWRSGAAPNTQATMNPMALLNLKDDKGTVNRFIGNAQIDYRMHFLPDLRANLNLGYDYTIGEGTVFIPDYAPQTFARGGVNNQYSESKTNKVLDFFLNYNTYVESIKSNIDVMAGYSYQDWLTHTDLFPDRRADGSVYVPNDYPYNEPRHTLISFYGRLNYTFMDRYLLTATVRRDGSSRFSPDNRWGTFPSLALAWRIKEESFLKDVDVISDLKFRVGYGVTGQQDGIADYSYMPIYSNSKNTAQYLFGETFYTMARPAAYDSNIKWEQTDTYNIAVDFGFFNGRLGGSLDFYLKKTYDLLSVIPVAAGSTFANELLTNIGNIENRGIELNINATPVQTKDWNWDLNFNFTYNKNEVTKLTQVDDPDYIGVQTGDVDGGTGTKIQIHSVGYPTYSFYVYKQVYDTKGNPIEGLYADMNGDGIINEKDLYRSHSAEPDVMMGFSTSLRYKQWTLSTSLRASIGNYMFNNVSSNFGAYRLVLNPLNYIQNAPASLLKSNFYNSQYQSDYYLENASFLKMDNLMLSYDFGRLWKNQLGLRVNFGVQNVFTITDYSGLDPEIPGGIDKKFYPRSRTYTLGVNIDLF